MIKSVLFSFLLFFTLSISSFGQDTIYFKSDEKVIAVINEISQTEIRYKLFYYPANPEVLKSTKRIEKIVFSNGDIWYYNKKIYFTQFNRNIVAFHISDLIYQDFTISYEHIFKNGKLGLKIPLSIGIIHSANYSDPYVYDNIFYSGLGLNIYTKGQQIVSYFFGPEFQFGSGTDMVESWNADTYLEDYKEVTFNYSRFFINNGVTYTPIANFRLSVVLGLGLRDFYIKDYRIGQVTPIFYFTVSMGYRF